MSTIRDDKLYMRIKIWDIIMGTVEFYRDIQVVIIPASILFTIFHPNHALGLYAFFYFNVMAAACLAFLFAFAALIKTYEWLFRIIKGET